MIFHGIFRASDTLVNIALSNVSILGDKHVNAACNFAPFHKDFAVVGGKRVLCILQTLRVVPSIKTRTTRTARTVFIFKEVSFFLCCMLTLEKFFNAEFTALNAAARCEKSVLFVLGNKKFRLKFKVGVSDKFLSRKPQVL